LQQNHLRLLPTQPLPLDDVGVIKTEQSSSSGGLEGNIEDMSTWVQCEFCDYRCPKKDRLSRHVRNVHYKEKPYGCNLCDACFGRKDKMKRHMATVHSQERPFKCDFCSHSSGRKDKIREHVNSVHLKNRPPRPSKSGGSKSHKAKKAIKSLPEMQHPVPVPVTDIHQQLADILSLPQHPIPPHEINSSGSGLQIMQNGGNLMTFPVNLMSGVHYSQLHHQLQQQQQQQQQVQPVLQSQQQSTAYKLVTS
jgi:hypothetical protein